MTSTVGSKFLAFVIAYIGEWPVYTNLFLQSCARNSHIDFLLFSETPPKTILPKNVHHHAIKRQDLQKRFEKTLDTPLSPLQGRKLSDYKVFYGQAFADYLAEYEFYGYCDIDLVFGDLSWSLNPTRLAELDVFSPHDAYVVGHCAVFRNLEKLRLLFRKIPDYKQKALKPTRTAIDERAITSVLLQCPDIRYGRSRSLQEQIDRERAEIGVTAFSSVMLVGLGAYPGFSAEWSKGKCVLDLANGHRPEIMYFHFMALKRWPFWLLYFAQQDYGAFSISGVGFLPFILRPMWLQKFFCVVSGSIPEIARRFLRPHRDLSLYPR